MKNTMQLGLDTIALVNGTVVPNIIGDLDGIAQRRKVITNQMSDKFTSVSAQVSDVAGTIKSSEKTKHDIAETLGNDCISNIVRVHMIMFL
jgi:hypothetical protein